MYYTLHSPRPFSMFVVSWGLYLILCLFQTNVFQSFPMGSDSTHECTASSNLCLTKSRRDFIQENTEIRAQRMRIKGKKGGGLMIDTNHILPERSLHTQTAALCCLGYVPYHNKSWVFFLHFIHLNHLLCTGELSLTCLDTKLITSKLPVNDAKSSCVKKQPCSLMNVLGEMCECHSHLSQLIF